MFRHIAHAYTEERPVCGSQFFSSIKLRLGVKHHYPLRYLVGPWLFILSHKTVKLLTSKRSPKQPVLKQLLTTSPLKFVYFSVIRFSALSLSSSVLSSGLELDAHFKYWSLGTFLLGHLVRLQCGLKVCVLSSAYI